MGGAAWSLGRARTQAGQSQRPFGTDVSGGSRQLCEVCEKKLRSDANESEGVQTRKVGGSDCDCARDRAPESPAPPGTRAHQVVGARAAVAAEEVPAVFADAAVRLVLRKRGRREGIRGNRPASRSSRAWKTAKRHVSFGASAISETCVRSPSPHCRSPRQDRCRYSPKAQAPLPSFSSSRHPCLLEAWERASRKAFSAQARPNLRTRHQIPLCTSQPSSDGRQRPAAGMSVSLKHQGFILCANHDEAQPHLFNRRVARLLLLRRLR